MTTIWGRGSHSGWQANFVNKIINVSKELGTSTIVFIHHNANIWPSSEDFMLTCMRVVLYILMYSNPVHVTKQHFIYGIHLECFHESPWISIAMQSNKHMHLIVPERTHIEVFVGCISLCVCAWISRCCMNLLTTIWEEGSSFSNLVNKIISLSKQLETNTIAIYSVIIMTLQRRFYVCLQSWI